MNKNLILKFIYDNVRVTIRTRYNKYYLDFIFNGKRIKRSTGLVANETNLKELKRNIIPEIFKTLTGNTIIEYLKKDILFNEFSIKFFEIYKGSGVREHIYEANYSIYEKQIKPYFLKYNIDEIKPLQLEEWQNKLLDKYSTHTVIRYRSILNLILNKAFENDIININPLSKVKYPSSINKKFKKLDELEETEIHPFNKDEILKILDNAKGNLYYFIYIMLCTGMRPGEIISLTWNDINFEKKRIAVDKTTVRGKIGNVKTQSSVRYVDIIPALEKELKSLQELNISDKYLFISNYKKPYYSHIVIAKHFKKLLFNINIKDRNLYNLRHTFASSMITAGHNILWISQMLGHKDISITMKVYARFVKEDDEKRIENLSKIVPNF
ncbi:MAG: tyrosine-type recombinase/integrase [Arcobacter sp.]|jgi:integrase|uniref:tyrosine-type recombinase/integrase n=1 Tax=Arcobacter sp. TaxID=1872629 RepID=UPI002A74DDDB|nr:tyrosine-type recombinase/integrase [Arcobacter sp.]MDY3205751.1 tyrosine-type recombinase/integrase [Arcobacter sp.]